MGGPKHELKEGGEDEKEEEKKEGKTTEVEKKEIGFH